MNQDHTAQHASHHTFAYTHGGDVYSHAVKLDFSANLNPLGMPKEVVTALQKAAPTFDIYPDSHMRHLTAAIAKNQKVSPNQVICTAGASDLIIRTVWACRPKKALVTAPCFSEYEHALAQVNARVYHHVLRDEENFVLTERIVDELAPDKDLLILCNPENPTGLTIDTKLLEAIISQAAANDITVLLDECFLAFTDEPSAVRLCSSYPNLIVMKAFTKLYAMAGLRLGFGICANPALLAHLHKMGQAWPISTPAEVAGLAALNVLGWPQKTREYVRAAREQLAAGLKGLGLRVLEGKANYLMFQCGKPLYEELLARGILIRQCYNYHGLDNTWYRVAVKRPEDNACLLAALRDVLNFVKS